MNRPHRTAIGDSITPSFRSAGSRSSISRGNPTVPAEVTLASGVYGYVAAPAGASTGSREAIDLRNAVGHVNGEILNAVRGLDAADQAGLGFRQGANALLAVTLDVAKAASAERDLPLYRHIDASPALMLPVPMTNITKGGAYADTREQPSVHEDAV